MVFAVNQNPRPILSSVFSTVAGIVVLDSAVYIIGVPNIKFVGFPALEDINVVLGYFFETLHFNTTGLPQGTLCQAELHPAEREQVSSGKVTGEHKVLLRTCGQLLYCSPFPAFSTKRKLAYCRRICKPLDFAQGGEGFD